MTRYCHYQPYKLVSRDKAPLKNYKSDKVALIMITRGA